MSSGVVAATTFIGGTAGVHDRPTVRLSRNDRADGVRVGPPSVSADSSCGLSGDGGLQPKPAIVPFKPVLHRARNWKFESTPLQRRAR